MKYFLVAPLAGTVASQMATPARSSQVTMRSRVDYAAQELTQSWRPLDRALASSDSKYSVTGAWLVTLLNRSFLALVAEAPDKLKLSHSETEAALSDVAVDFATSHPEITATPLWVSRTALLPTGAAARPGWTDVDATTITLGTATLTLGWGNNAIVGWDDTVEPDQSHLLLGILNAQYLWTDIEALSNESAASTHEIVDPASASSPSLRGKLLLMEEMSSAIALHNLAYDDLLMHVQGAQRATAVALLTSWNYRDVADRITRRIADTTRVLEQKISRQERRFQSIVEGVLFGLALIAFIDLGLTFILAAIDSHESGIEFEHSPFGILPRLAATDPDFILITSVIFAVAIAALIGVLRLRRR